MSAAPTLVRAALLEHEWHCPPGCAERVAVPREYHRAVAAMRRYLPVYPASG